MDKATGRLQMIPLEGEYVMRMEARFLCMTYGPSTAGKDTEFDAEARRMQNKQYSKPPPPPPAGIFLRVDACLLRKTVPSKEGLATQYSILPCGL